MVKFREHAGLSDRDLQERIDYVAIFRSDPLIALHARLIDEQQFRLNRVLLWHGRMDKE